MRRHWLMGLVLLGAAAAVTSSARAQSAADKETARTHMDNADARFQAKDFAEALRLYQAADDIMHVPTTGLEVARTLAQMNRLVEAYDRALAVTRLPSASREPAPFVEARKRAQALADQLAQRIPSLVVKVRGVAPDVAVRVEVDGAPIAPSAALLPLKLDPGKHQIGVTAPGYKPAELEQDIPEGQLTETVVELEPASAPEPAAVPAPVQAKSAPAASLVAREPQWTPETEPEIPMLAYVGFGVGALGVGVGAVTGTWSWAKTASLRDVDCGGGNDCSAESESDRAMANTLANISNVAFGVGLVGVGLGVYALVTAGSEQPPSSADAGELRFDVARGQPVRLRPELGPNGVGLSGRF